jgi:hypothetical protein
MHSGQCSGLRGSGARSCSWESWPQISRAQRPSETPITSLKLMGVVYGEPTASGMPQNRRRARERARHQQGVLLLIPAGPRPKPGARRARMSSFARGGNAGYDTYITGPDYSTSISHPASIKVGPLSQVPNTSPRPFPALSRARLPSPGQRWCR